MVRAIRKLFKFAVLTTLVALITTGALLFWFSARSRGKIYRPVQSAEAPHPAQVALIPGASVLPSKQPSNTLLNRLRAGIELYNRQIVPKLLLSGDNTRRFYDEVHTMRDYCLRHGVKPEDIFLDHAGVRTYDTMARARGTYAVKTAIVVSQDIYLPRALFLAEKQGIKAEGYVAESSSFDNTYQAQGREYLARLKSMLDVYVLKPVVAQDGPLPVTGDGRASWTKKKTD
ncbi:MAG: YdcF family protein [Leptospiraceae bacterium]|nr:YdcF family protein [Leptospiraceae bacterium]